VATTRDQNGCGVQRYFERATARRIKWLAERNSVKEFRECSNTRCRISARDPCRAGDL
jgi:hypothetical protein